MRFRELACDTFVIDETDIRLREHAIAVQNLIL